MNRRQLLSAVALAGTVPLAGCSGPEMTAPPRAEQSPTATAEGSFTGLAPSTASDGHASRDLAWDQLPTTQDLPTPPDSATALGIRPPVRARWVPAERDIPPATRVEWGSPGLAGARTSVTSLTSRAPSAVWWVRYARVDTQGIPVASTPSAFNLCTLGEHNDDPNSCVVSPGEGGQRALLPAHLASEAGYCVVQFEWILRTGKNGQTQSVNASYATRC